MSTLLSIDLASCTGWAIGTAGMTSYGSERFSGALGSRALQFEEWLKEKVTPDVSALAIEAPVPVRGATNLDTLAWLLGTHVIARKIAVRRCRLIIVGVGTWRSFFIGCAHAPKKDPFTGQPLVTPHTRRMWLKARTIRECKKLGFDPKDDNAADAIGILQYCRAALDPKTGIDHADLYAEAA